MIDKKLIKKYNLTNIYSDGATKGCNGKLGTVKQVGLGIYIPDKDIGKGKMVDGISNNEAEFLALLWAMETALELGITNGLFNLDSLIVVNRANGRRPRNKHKNERMDYFQDKVLILKKSFKQCWFDWIPREKNVMADYYSKKCLE